MPLSPEQQKKLVALQSKLALASVGIPSPLGDIVGLGSDALGYYADPSQRTPLNGLLTVASLLPGIPSASAAKAAVREGRGIFDLSDAAKAAVKDMPSFEDQMAMVETLRKQSQGPLKLDALFDAEKGIGAVPNNLDVKHLGRVEYMTPDQYLGLAEKLANPSQKSVDFIKQGLAKGDKLGQPTLTIDMVKGSPRVVNHDGRHRMTVIKELFGNDVQVPVHLIGMGDRVAAKTAPLASIKPQGKTFDEAKDELDALLARADELLQRRKDR